MTSAKRWISVSALAACASVASPAYAQSASTPPPEVYLCPSATNTYVGETKPIACNGEQCVGGNSTTLSESQKQFLESQKGDCRYLDEQEASLLLPEKKPEL